MSSVPELQLRDELLSRRARLGALRDVGAMVSVGHLIAEVDAALERLDAGAYGLCDTCHDPIEAERLVADPLTRFCIDHMTQQQRVQLERDLELARDIQRALLPPRDVQLPGWQVHYVYQPAGTVSGDYCDVIATGTAMPSVAVGDVSGKGVAASILMSNLHALFRGMAASGAPFAETVSRVNHIFCASTLPSSFATLVFARLHPSGAVDICNAGHCPPILLQDGRVQSIPPTGTAVGLFGEGQFGVVGHALAPGDVMVLYTDGLTETFDENGEEFGSERLADMIASLRGAPPRELARACLQAVRAFGAGAPPRDDLTLMVLERSQTGRRD
jgi:sigma-B regulation protein RsbU (phosphoserine phosphatase)